MDDVHRSLLIKKCFSHQRKQTAWFGICRLVYGHSVVKNREACFKFYHKLAHLAWNFKAPNVLVKYDGNKDSLS
jgi:hypothetical protein